MNAHYNNYIIINILPYSIIRENKGGGWGESQAGPQANKKHPPSLLKALLPPPKTPQKRAHLGRNEGDAPRPRQAGLQQRRQPHVRLGRVDRLGGEDDVITPPADDVSSKASPVAGDIAGGGGSGGSGGGVEGPRHAGAEGGALRKGLCRRDRGGGAAAGAVFVAASAADPVPAVPWLSHGSARARARGGRGGRACPGGA